MTGRPSDIAARNIKAFRALNNWTAQDLADKLAAEGETGLSAAVIANIETGRRDEEGRRRRDVTVDELIAFARAFGITPSSLLPELSNGEGAAIPEVAEREASAAALMAALDRPDVRNAIRATILGAIQA